MITPCDTCGAPNDSFFISGEPCPRCTEMRAKLTEPVADYITACIERAVEKALERHTDSFRHGNDCGGYNP